MPGPREPLNGRHGIRERTDHVREHESPRRAAVPYLAVRGAREAVDWYGTVFGAVVDGEPFENDDGTIGHVALRVADGVFYLADEAPAYDAVAPTGPGAAVSLGLAGPPRRGRRSRPPCGRGRHPTTVASTRATASSPRGSSTRWATGGASAARCRPETGARAGPREAGLLTVGLALVTETPPDTLPESGLPDQLQVRRDKRERLLAAGVPAYPVSVPHPHPRPGARAPGATWRRARRPPTSSGSPAGWSSSAPPGSSRSRPSRRASGPVCR